MLIVTDGGTTISEGKRMIEIIVEEARAGFFQGQRWYGLGSQGSLSWPAWKHVIIRLPVIWIVLAAVLIFHSALISGYAAAGEYIRQDLFSVNFPTVNDGWACGRWGAILHTKDGGTSWEAQESGTDYTLASIYFVDAQRGWAVGDGETIIHTADGGKSWEKQQAPDVMVKDKEVPLSSFLMKVHFANERQGWIVTERTTILYTDDGGKNWRIQFKDQDFVLKSVSFCDERHGWAVGEFGYIYHTQNGGESWEHQAGYFDISAETGEIVGGNFLFDVVAVNPATAWVAGIDGYVARTADGGASWQVVKEGIPMCHLFGIASDGQRRLFIGGNGILLSQVKGEERFREPQVMPPIIYGWLYNIARRGDAGFVGVGKGGWIYVSDREGMKWVRAAY